MNKKDYKKEYKDIYMPSTKPSLIKMPPIQYATICGRGNPNVCSEYKEAIELLYGLSYTIKMSKMGSQKIPGYFEYVVPPLEGLWWIEDGYFDGLSINDKDKMCWKSMIRLPEFVNQDIFEWAKKSLSQKKPHLPIDKLHFEIIDEGLCVQVMHIGSFDDEPRSIMKINQFIKDNNFVCDIHDERYHHEIYLSDPRKTKLENLKTVIRHPIKRNKSI